MNRLINIQELNKKASELFFGGDPDEDSRVSAYASGNDVNLEVSQMFEYVPFSYKIIKELESITGCDEIDVDQDYSKGCDTCDFGSKYEITFIFKNCGIAN